MNSLYEQSLRPNHSIEKLLPDLKSATVDMLHARGQLVHDSMDCFSLYQKMLNNIPAVTSQRSASYCPHPARLLSVRASAYT
jgi:hypothetical protein